jgi:hypothetical protein
MFKRGEGFHKDDFQQKYNVAWHHCETCLRVTEDVVAGRVPQYNTEIQRMLNCTSTS